MLIVKTAVDVNVVAQRARTVTVSGLVEARAGLPLVAGYPIELSRTQLVQIA